MRALLAVLGLSLGLLMGGATASADSGSLPTCEDLLHGPPKEVAASKTVDASTVNADGSVTMAVTVSWSFAVHAKPGEKVFDCVWNGQPGQSSVVGSTGHPGADCSQQGLPCRFTVTTERLSPGSHTLCDIAKILGTWPMPNPGDGPSPSGSRTPSVCVTVQIPGPPGQGGGGNGGGTSGQGHGTTSAQTAASASGQSTPGLPATGRATVDVPLLAGSLAGGGALILLGVFLAVRPYWKGV
ncbi:MAG TPA: hypothetical protein VGO86_15960 [Candidatus Dormibacteraeota bacterium]